jgi:hypothetical protein
VRVSGTLSRAYTIRSLSAAFVELARPASARRCVVGMPRSLSAIAIPVALAIPSARMALMTGHRGPSASSAPAAARLKASRTQASSSRCTCFLNQPSGREKGARDEAVIAQLAAIKARMYPNP